MKISLQTNSDIQTLQTLNTPRATETNTFLKEEDKIEDIDLSNRYTDNEKKLGNNIICCNSVILG